MSSPSHHLAKRRRLEDAKSALSRPFRSPLKNQIKDAGTSAASSGISENVWSENTKHPARRSTSSVPIDRASMPYRSPTKASSTRQSSLLKKYSPSKPTPDPPEIRVLRDQHRSLQSQLSTLKAELDTANHALRIENQRQDQELRELITKWKLASREAATMVFDVARDKVEKTGGIRAWQERERERSTGGGLGNWGWDDDQKGGADTNKERWEEACDNSKAEQAMISTSAEEDREDFTMAMMFKTMNIDPLMIGYDAKADAWID